MIRNVPTHDEVARVLRREMPDVAEALLEETQWCWGDLLLEAQRRWSPVKVARIVRTLVRAGWGECIRLTWCPLTSELDRAYRDALARIGNDRTKLGSRSIYGAIITRIRGEWRRARSEWMERWAVDESHGEVFEDMIDAYLCSKEG